MKTPLLPQKIKIVADENLALTDYFFAEFGEITHLAGRNMTQDDVRGADVLLLRSVTRVNRELLQGSTVRFIGSATIGTDHIDLDYLAEQNIVFANAPGCNAQAVAEYVITAILTLQPDAVTAGQNFCLGIVGLGNVGTRLARLAEQLGWRIIGTDPNVNRPELENLPLLSLLAQADAISLHVPLNWHGEHSTYHLLNEATLSLLKPSAILINSARGEVVSEHALLKQLDQNQQSVVLDVFEHEPVITQTLLNHLALATPHIAGYSLEGKARGTQMVYEAFCRFYNRVADKNFASQLPELPQHFDNAQPLANQLPDLLSLLYPIKADDRALKHSLTPEGVVSAQAFDGLRKHYPLRREWSAYGWLQ